MAAATGTAGRQMILVLGMHRSGTSAVTGMLAKLGADPSEHLIPAAPDNPKGFFEHADLWKLDQDLLQALGSDWDDPAPLPDGWAADPAALEAAAGIRRILRRDFASSALAVIKDPRLCRLLPLWRKLLVEDGWSPRIVLAMREPAAVIASLVKRDASRPAEAAGVWLRYQLEAEASTRGMARVVAPYGVLLRDWRGEARRIASALDIAWPRPIDTAARDIDPFIDVGLQHHGGAAHPRRVDGLDPRIAGWLRDVYEAFTAAPGIDTQRLDAVGADLARLDAGSAIYRAPMQRLRSDNRRIRGELDWQRKEAEGMAAGNARLEAQVRDYAAEREQMVAGNAYLEGQVRAYGEERERITARNEQLVAGLQQRTGERDELARNLANVSTHRDQLAAEVQRVFGSRSWRITRPLRGAMRALRWLRGSAPRGAAPASGGPPRGAAEPQPDVVTPAPPAPGSAVVEGVAPAAAAIPATADIDSGADTETLLATSFARAKGHRILIATPDIVGPIRNGGIGTAFHALALALAQAGHRVTILYTLGDHCEGGTTIAHWQHHYAALGVRFLPLRQDPAQPKLDAPWHPRRAYALYLWLRQHQGNYDIAYFPEWKGEAYYALQARRLGLEFEHLALAVVTHSPTMWAESGNYRLPDKLDTLDLVFMERRTAELADALVSPSRYMLDWEAQHGWRAPADTRVLQNLMAEPPIDPAGAMDSVAVHEWVFFGRLEVRKGLRIFLDALQRIPQERRAWHAITFLGKADRTPEFDPVALIHARLDDWPQPVTILADCDRDQALGYLQRPGRLAVIASLVENSPYTVLECLTRRIPFVAADVGGIAELVHPDDRDRVLFKPNPAALARILQSFDGRTYALPRPAVPAAATRAAWLALQDELQALAVRGFAPPPLPAPHITVCLVHHERPRMLARALESLRKQTYRDFDVVLVDDGSASAPAIEYLASLEQDFARRGWTLVRQDNAYLGAARNRAVRHARGEYVMFMDDDNIAKPHELATFAHAARVADADILTTVSDVFADTAALAVPTASREYWIPLGNARGLGVFRNVFGDANALVRRSLFEKLGGFTEDYGVGHEDWEFFARASLAGAKLYLVPEPLFWYRVDPHSMLRLGQADRDYARSVRPYRQGLAQGVGAALAYALHVQQHQHDAAPTAPDPGTIAVPEPLPTAPAARFAALWRRDGWRGATASTLHYIGRRLSSR